jgi:hypothetical protein
LLFWCGWLTGGILWFIGALVPDEGDSPRQRRLASIGLGAAVAALFVLGLLGARPAPVLGVNGNVLGSSVGGIGLLSVEKEDCWRDDGWVCSVYDGQLSSTVIYRVQVKWTGCWQATRVGPSEGSSPKKLEGCASLVNFVF